MFSSIHSHTHTITAEAVDLEHRALVAALAQGGYDPTGLEFGDQAAQRLVDDTVGDLTELGIVVAHKAWTIRATGEVELQIELARQQDVIAAKLALA